MVFSSNSLFIDGVNDVVLGANVDVNLVKKRVPKMGKNFQKFGFDFKTSIVQTFALKSVAYLKRPSALNDAI